MRQVGRCRHPSELPRLTVVDRRGLVHRLLCLVGCKERQAAGRRSVTFTRLHVLIVSSGYLLLICCRRFVPAALQSARWHTRTFSDPTDGSLSGRNISICGSLWRRTAKTSSVSSKRTTHCPGRCSPQHPQFCSTPGRHRQTMLRAFSTRQTRRLPPPSSIAPATWTDSGLRTGVSGSSWAESQPGGRSGSRSVKGCDC